MTAVGPLCLTGTAHGHQLNSASLSLSEVESKAGRFLIRWQASSATLERELATPVVFPSPCRVQWPYVECGNDGLVGSLEFPWLKGTETNLMVDIEWSNGTRLLRVVTASSPSMVVYGIPASAGLRFLKPIALDYTRLGIEHILTGFDHLLFVFALALLVRRGKPLVASITAFTVAHSLTLACAVLGLLRLPSPPVEAAIALSIVLVCAECIRPADSLTRRAPWVVTFAFGLLHGLGFASSLLAVGLPEKHVPAALFFFNVGVEIGQLGAIALVFALRFLVSRLRVQRAVLGRGLVYAMGSTAAYWSIERILAVFAG
jgi:hydrogenase/urease accessory protein HupE